MRRGTWAPAADRILREKYPIQGSNIPELSQYTRRQIQSRANVLGISREYWSDEEDRILKENYKKHGADIPELKHKSAAAIRSRAAKLGEVQKCAWSPQEDDLIRKLYPSAGVRIPELTHRTAEAVGARARALGVRYVGRWSAGDIGILREKYQTHGSTIPELLGRHSAQEIRIKARDLGLHTTEYWTEEEVELLRKHYQTHGCNIPGINRTAKAIKGKASSLGLRMETGASPWTEAEIAALKSAYAAGEKPEFETHSADSIKAKARELGISVDRRWTKAEIEVILESYPEGGVEAVLKRLPKRSRQSILGKASQLGIRTAVRYSDRADDAKYVRDAGAGYKYVMCRVCGQNFLVQSEGYKEFKHSEHRQPVPEGWALPKSASR